jgi:hypothetical protein
MWTDTTRAHHSRIPIGGEGTNVEIDETLMGGVKRGKHNRGSAAKTVVVGALQRGHPQQP